VEDDPGRARVGEVVRVEPNTVSGWEARTLRAAWMNSRYPFSRTRRPTVPTTTESSSAPHVMRSSRVAAGGTRTGAKRERSTPFPSQLARSGETSRERSAYARSSSLWNSSAFDNRAAMRSAPPIASRRPAPSSAEV
jgi:hypothetical protein